MLLLVVRSIGIGNECLDQHFAGLDHGWSCCQNFNSKKELNKDAFGWRKRAESTREREFTIYKGVSDRPLGWKARRAARTTATGQMGRDVLIRKWDGAVRRSIVWDDMRRVN